MELVVTLLHCRACPAVADEVGGGGLLIFGPRKGGRWPSTFATVVGAAFLLWFLAAMGFGSLWNRFFGTLPQP